MERTKTVKKNFWLSPEENKLMIERAKRAGLTQSSLIRMLLRGFVPKDQPSQKLLKAVMDQINLINQMDRLVDEAEIHGYKNAEKLRVITEKFLQITLIIEEELRLPEDRTDFWKQ